MSNLVRRLREEALWNSTGPYSDTTKLLREAADVLERLGLPTEGDDE